MADLSLAGWHKLAYLTELIRRVELEASAIARTDGDAADPGILQFAETAKTLTTQLQDFVQESARSFSPKEMSEAEMGARLDLQEWAWDSVPQGRNDRIAHVSDLLRNATRTINLIAPADLPPEEELPANLAGLHATINATQNFVSQRPPFRAETKRSWPPRPEEPSGGDGTGGRSGPRISRESINNGDDAASWLGPKRHSGPPMPPGAGEPPPLPWRPGQPPGGAPERPSRIINPFGR